MADDHWAFWCPGCQDVHVINSRWRITSPESSPTISPSVLVTTGHFCPGFKPGEDCWCTLHEKSDEKDPPGFKCGRCHSFVENGNIRFLDDCTHDLKGKTVPLPPWKP